MEMDEKMQRALDRLTQARSFLRSAEAMIRDAGQSLNDHEVCREVAQRLTSDLGVARDSTEQLIQHIHGDCSANGAADKPQAR